MLSVMRSSTLAVRTAFSAQNEPGVRVDVQTLLRHGDSSSARTNRDSVIAEMRRALDMIQTVVTDSGAQSSTAGDTQPQPAQTRRDNPPRQSPPPLSVNAADSGISLSQLQTTAFRAIKEFEVLRRLLLS